jgi:hypothetical protein
MSRLLALAAVLFWLLPPGLAGADGDPASDVLLGQDVFLPYSSISQPVERRLYAVTQAARHTGQPLKIALVGARTDLGVVTALFGRPGPYARFLSTELGAVYTGPVLVVMPNGFGLAAQGRARPLSALAGLPIGAGSDGLGTAAVSATERLAAAGGHPLPPSAYAQSPSLGAAPATVRHALTALAILAAVAAVALAGAFIVRTR